MRHKVATSWLVDRAEGLTPAFLAAPCLQVFFWSYTDLYKWSILSQRHKIALQVPPTTYRTKNTDAFQLST